jgi:uncharacterized protein YdcH (DUF465 family)
MREPTRWQDVKAMLDCRLSNNSHFCANCGNRLDDIWPAIERAREASAQQAQEIARLKEQQLQIAGAVNGYYNSEEQPDALMAFSALRLIADALGKPMEPD